MSTRYTPKQATCERCGKPFVYYKSTARFCSRACDHRANRETNTSGGRLRAERDEARALAIEAWALLGRTPDNNPVWLRTAM